MTAACAALAATFLLGACGGSSGSSASEDGGKSGVASVTGGKDGTQAPQQSQDVRPLIRPDTSDEESSRVFYLYYECLQRNGVKTIKQGEVLKPLESSGPVFEKAHKQCWQKEPEYLAERASREDPEYHDKMDRWVRCLSEHGVRAVVGEKGNIVLPDNLPPEPKAQWIDKCELQAFVAK
ncbi:hypothetical protein [Streptomyces sp. NPDC086787]|uniref:hypothetical protein n=1 Tax=Streptomyces sp. NPDC086787 TaxID=3365759 RepID=UPI0037F876E1